ncbi:MAG: 2Fe-2S iron-sulfur cluster-binding protein [Steroidobacteraceae bacterium]
MVKFTRSNLEAPFDPRALNLLEFAEDLGLSPPASCRSGICGTCATRKISGAIRYVEEPVAEVADDEVLLCCALPDGPVSLEL